MGVREGAREVCAAKRTSDRAQGRYCVRNLINASSRPQAKSSVELHSRTGPWIQAKDPLPPQDGARPSWSSKLLVKQDDNDISVLVKRGQKKQVQDPSQGP